MNKIKHISELYSEQLRLQKLEDNLEKTIRKDWKEVKESMRPKNSGREMLSDFINKRLQDKIKSNGILSGTLSYGAAMLTKKIVEKVEEKMESFFGK
jgi:hypothetical protein